MSIPKEPRQLMINLMYLVLTALLALNVSAEVMNAFFSLEKGIKASNGIVEDSNVRISDAIDKQAEAYKTTRNDSIVEAADNVNRLTEEFVAFIEGIHTQIFEEAGGPQEDDPTKPKDYKNKDITTRLLVKGPTETKEDDGVGFEVMRKIEETRAEYLKWVQYVGGETGLAEVEPNVTLSLDKIPEGSDKTSWPDYKFRQMPVAAVFPMLRKMQGDAKASSSVILNYFYKKIAGDDKIIFDQFTPVLAAKKGYVIRGEQYEADVFLSAYASAAGDNTRIFVNGSQLEVEAGKASYTTTPRGIGPQKVNVKIEVENPLTGKVDSYEQVFEYEVGEPSVTVSAEKMNVFYIGVENPIAVSAAGVSSNDLRVSASGGGASLRKINTNNYIVTVKQPTDDCRINVSGGELKPVSKQFRVKRIPDPVARLGNKEDGQMGNGEFKAQQGLIAWLDNFDFDARCDIQGFKLVRVPSRSDPIESLNSGGRFTSGSKRIVDQAKPGDTYYFFDVKARCPGDVAGRKINSLVFNIR